MTAYLRSPQKAEECGFGEINIVQGDVLDTEKLAACLKENQVLVGILSGDLLRYAESITQALKSSSAERVIWVTGMGIHHEVPGATGKMLDMLVKKMPEYVQAADMIAESGTPCTLIRAAHLTDGKNGKYFVQHEGEKLHSNSVDRIAVANFIADLIEKNEGINESLGVTN